MNTYLILVFGIMNLFLSGEAVAQGRDQQLAKVDALYRQENLGWPGLKWSEAPLVLTYEDGEVYAWGLENAGEGWNQTKAGESNILMAEQDLWGLGQLKMHPSFEIGDQETFLFQMNGDRAVKILAHERFHRYQMDRFEEGAASGGYLQHLNGENVALMGLEESLLQEFVQNGRVESLKEYVAVHRERVKMLDEESLAWEEMQLRFEGLADYVAVKMTGDELSVLAKIDDERLVENAMKWRNYGVGAALGLGLDALKVSGWQQAVEKGASLNQLLDQQFQFSKDEDKALIKTAKKRLNFKRKRKKALDQVGAYEAKLQGLKQDFDEAEGVEIKVGSLNGVGVSGGGRSAAIYYLSDGSQVSVMDQSLSTSVDGRWSFETKAPSTLYQLSGGFRKVKASKDCAVVLDAQPFVAQGDEPKEYPFSSLKMESDEISFSAKEAQGILVKQGNRLAVYFAE
jgi:hypothetical protein